MFLQPAGVKDYTTLLLCSYSTTSAIQLSIEILGPLLSLRSLSAGVGERICTGQRPRGPLRLAGTGSKDRSFHANMRCDAMQSRLALACVSGFPCLASSLRPTTLLQCFSSSCAENRKVVFPFSWSGGRALAPSKDHSNPCPLPPSPDRARLMSFSQCQLSCLRHHQSTTSAFAPAGFSLTLSLSTSAFELAAGCCRSNGRRGGPLWPQRIQ